MLASWVTQLESTPSWGLNHGVLAGKAAGRDAPTSCSAGVEGVEGRVCEWAGTVSWTGCVLPGSPG